jgi:hypothetical protein
MAFQSYRAIKIGKMMRKIDNMPRHLQARCPNCSENPPIAAIWRCPCGNAFDTFAANG